MKNIMLSYGLLDGAMHLCLLFGRVVTYLNQNVQVGLVEYGRVQLHHVV